MLCVSKSVPVSEESYCWALPSLEGPPGMGTCTRPGARWQEPRLGLQRWRQTGTLVPGTRLGGIHSFCLVPPACLGQVHMTSACAR